MASPQFTLYSHAGGPNGFKVVYVLEALKLSYKSVYLDFGKQEQKALDFVKLNPNGRIPALVDHHNGDFAIWESDAIMLYLIDTYDKSNTLTSTDPKEKAEINQWLFFQSSGQGAYFGQFAHFHWFAPEKVPYGVTRYQNEFLRVCDVLEAVLATKTSGWLVGNKCTIADLSFVPWNVIALANFFPEGKSLADYPALGKWHQSLVALPHVAAGIAEKARASA